MDNKITGRLENWSLDLNYYGTGDIVIWGDMYDDIHKRWEEGKYVHTSKIIQDVSNLKDGDIVSTSNSKYLLGKKFVNDSR